MNPDVFSAIIDLLRSDSVLVSLLGGEHIYRAKGVQPAHIPSVTVQINNETGTNRAGYAASLHRDESYTIQVDIWIATNQGTTPCTGEDADWIADRIDAVLLSATPPAETRNWTKTSSSVQDDSDIGGIHIARRYSFDCNVINN